jgi:hypothetical protein
MGLRGLLRGFLYFLYVDDIRTSQKTSLWGLHGLLREKLNFILSHHKGIWGNHGLAPPLLKLLPDNG